MSNSPTPARPWQRRRPRPYRREILLDVAPKLQLDIYDQMVIVTRRAGKTWLSYPVNPAAIGQALADVPMMTGLLAPNTLAAGLVHGQPFNVLYVPPLRARLQVEEGRGVKEREIQTPPMVWAGAGQDYRIFALRKDAFPGYMDADLPLYHAPFSNVYTSGAICWGTTDGRPSATAVTMLPVLKLFLEGSRFTQHLAGGKSIAKEVNVLLVYAGLDPEKPYPVADLIPTTFTLGWLTSAGPWS